LRERTYADMKIALLGASHWHASCYHRPAAEPGHEVVLSDEGTPRVREFGDCFGYRRYDHCDTLTGDVVRQLAAEADDAGVFHAAAFSLRLDRRIVKIKELLDSGCLGRIARCGLSYFAGPAHRCIDWKDHWVLDREQAGDG